MAKKTAVAVLTRDQVNNLVRKLKAGKTFYVGSASERKWALEAAKILGIKVTTRKQDGVGFIVMALP